LPGWHSKFFQEGCSVFVLPYLPIELFPVGGSSELKSQSFRVLSIAQYIFKPLRPTGVLFNIRLVITIDIQEFQSNCSQICSTEISNLEEVCITRKRIPSTHLVGYSKLSTYISNVCCYSYPVPLNLPIRKFQIYFIHIYVKGLHFF
jgi:hypothetical protein